MIRACSEHVVSIARTKGGGGWSPRARAHLSVGAVRTSNRSAFAPMCENQLIPSSYRACRRRRLWYGVSCVCSRVCRVRRLGLGAGGSALAAATRPARRSEPLSASAAADLRACTLRRARQLSGAACTSTNGRPTRTTRQPSTSQAAPPPARRTHTHTPSNMSAPQPAAVASPPLPADAIAAMITRLKSQAVQPTRPLGEAQREQLPLPSYASLHRPAAKLSLVQSSWTARASQPLPVEPFDEDHRPPVSALSSHPPPTPAAFPADCEPLARMTAQLRIDAALTSLETHEFAYRHRHTMPTASEERADPAAGSRARLERYACRNSSEEHRPAYLDPLLNRLHALRVNPPIDSRGLHTWESHQRQMHHEEMIRGNSLRIGRDLSRAANRERG